MTFLTRSKKALLIILCLLLASSVFGISKKRGTITLKDGTIFENVDFRVNKIYKVVEIFLSGEERNVSFTEIEKIENNKGEDITARELNIKKETSDKSWKSANEEVFKEKPKKKWLTSVGIHGNYSIPFDDYYDGVDGSIGFGGDFNIALTPDLSLKFLASKAGMKISNDYRIYSIDPNFSVISQEYSVSTWRFLLGVQYNYAIVTDKKHKGNWIFYTGLGAVAEKFEAEISIRDEVNMITYTDHGETSETYFLIAFGGGYQAMLSPRFAVDIGTNLDLIHIAQDNDGDIQYAGIIDFRIGITAFLGQDK